MWLNSFHLMGYYYFLIFLISMTASLTRKINPKIIVIGAGPSGIASAVRLLNNGFKDVLILEAEPRIGGRIHTIEFGRNVIDMGAQWCHGEKGNIVFEMAYEKGLLEYSPDREKTYSFVRSNSKQLSPNLTRRLISMTEELKDLRQNEVSNYTGSSLGSYMRKKFNELLSLPENDDLDKKIAFEFYESFEKEQSSDEGSDCLDVISARDYTIFQQIEGDYELNWKDKGYLELLRLLMKSDETGKDYGILDGRIKLNKRVNHINWQRNDQKILVKCEDGEEYIADHVIITMSLGVLKANYKEIFDPQLPKEKQNAIEALAYGSFDKVFLDFPQRFWPENWDGIVFLWREEDLNEIRGTNRSWLEGLYSFNTLPYQPNILEGWIIGEGARHMETMSLEEIQKGCVYLLNRFLPGEILDDPVNITISTWYLNSNFRGCYSYHSLETERADLNNQHLASVIKNCDFNNVNLCEKPVLQFAGEATHSTHYATVHGAVESGFREAQRINDYYASATAGGKS